MAVLFHMAKTIGNEHGGVDMDVVLVRLGQEGGYSAKLKFELRDHN